MISIEVCKIFSPHRITITQRDRLHIDSHHPIGFFAVFGAVRDQCSLERRSHSPVDGGCTDVRIDSTDHLGAEFRDELGEED